MSNFNEFTELSGKNPYAEHFENLQNTVFFQRLQQKFTPLPYYKKYKSLKWIALIASYLFNFFSGITASTLVYFFVLGLSASWIISALCTLIFIALIEAAKRKTNGLFFKDWLQFRKMSFSLLAILSLLLCLSVSFSYFGSKQLVQNFTPEPDLISSDSLTLPINAEIAAIDTQIAEARATKWQGVTTSKSQETIELLTKQKLGLQDKLFRIEGKEESSNDIIISTHIFGTDKKSEYFAALTFLLELFFILCAFYLEYYDYRSFAEFHRFDTNTDTPTHHNENIKENLENTNINLAYTRGDTKLQNGSHHNGVYKTAAVVKIDSTSKETIEKAIKLIRGRIASAHYRLRNGIGKPETSHKNIEKFKGELQELENMLIA